MANLPPKLAHHLLLLGVDLTPKPSMATAIFTIVQVSSITVIAFDLWRPLPDHIVYYAAKAAEFFYAFILFSLFMVYMHLRRLALVENRAGQKRYIREIFGAPINQVFFTPIGKYILNSIITLIIVAIALAADMHMLTFYIVATLAMHTCIYERHRTFVYAYAEQIERDGEHD